MPGYGENQYGIAPYGDPSFGPTRQIRSHLTQDLQNYFDPKDKRVREIPYTIDAQILNMAAVELEDLQFRINREHGRNFQTVPVNIDNTGVYYRGRIPASFDLSSPIINSVMGFINTVPYTVLPYDDTLPIPTAIQVDQNRKPVALTNPVLFTATGAGDQRTGIFTIQRPTIGTFPIPNRITFWLDNVNLYVPSVDIRIEGYTFPQSPWVGKQNKTAETILMTSMGSAETKFRWSQVTSVVIRNLPTNATLTAWSIPLQMSNIKDPFRSFIHSDYRDLEFPRYWSISTSEFLIKESYGTLTGLEYIQSYRTNDINTNTGINLVDLEIEPNTYGLLAISNNTLFYLDRREPLPGSLDSTAISVEPAFGIKAVYDVTKSGPTRYAELQPMPYGNAANVFRYRYTVNTPSNTLYNILPDGTFTALSSTAGWRGGAPANLSIPLLEYGTYVFSLECIDNTGQTTIDSFPYPNLRMQPFTSFNLNSIVPKAKGIAFDSFGQLWIWTGTYIVPVKFTYDNYVIDVDTKTMYLTKNYDRVEIA